MRFAALHRPGNPLVLPNAWDLGSARALVAEGFEAIGTTSLGVTASQGLPDATRHGRELTVESTSQLVAAGLGCFLTCDIEDGFADDPAEVADFVASLGVDGVNIEDATDGALVAPATHAAKIKSVKQRSPDVFVNARTDVFWLGQGGLDEAVRRARSYADAGADGVFLPGALDLGTIEAFVAALDVPVNVLASPTLTRQQYAGVGVARISTGSLLYRVAIANAIAAACAVREPSSATAGEATTNQSIGLAMRLTSRSRHSRCYSKSGRSSDSLTCVASCALVSRRRWRAPAPPKCSAAQPGVSRQPDVRRLDAARVWLPPSSIARTSQS